jgi:hypothetical protein
VWLRRWVGVPASYLGFGGPEPMAQAWVTQWAECYFACGSAYGFCPVFVQCRPNKPCRPPPLPSRA